jgi:hypothetical protein
MLSLKSMCWGLISLNLPTIPCFLLVYYSAYFVVKQNSLANHSLLHIIFCHKLCLFYITLVFVKASFISCLFDIHKHFIKLLQELISIDDVFPSNNVWLGAKFFLFVTCAQSMGRKCCKINCNIKRSNKSIIYFGPYHVFKSLSTRSWSCFVGATTNKHHGNQIPQCILIH